MSKRIVLSLPVLMLAIAAGTALAQNAEPPKSPEPQKFYKLEFVVKEVEAGKVLNARSYSMTAAGGAQNAASIRAGSKVPIASGGFAQGGAGAQSYRQFQYVDVGVNIDCRSIAELQRDLSLYVTAEVSSVPSEAAAASVPTDPPMVRQNKWSSWTVVPLKKATLIFSSDDLASKRQMQLELTVTPIP